jgi:16S rRNA (cytosine1402-N4)-methyltransferase
MYYFRVARINGILADLGVSSHHFDAEDRGFSYRYNAPLDMRMNRRAGVTAADLLNDYSEPQLADVLYLYGELKQARKMAASIVKARQQKRIETTQDLMDAIEKFVAKEHEKKEMAKVFQALRIEVNHEMEALKEMLCGAQ